jgi:hypothetical protein
MGDRDPAADLPLDPIRSDDNGGSVDWPFVPSAGLITTRPADFCPHKYLRVQQCVSITNPTKSCIIILYNDHNSDKSIS